MYRLRSTKVDPESKYECWPGTGMTSEHMDFALFSGRGSVEYVERTSNRGPMPSMDDKLIITDAELEECMQILEDDPIDDAFDDDDDE